MPKTVCVIGAGPSGLVAAKSLAYDHPNKLHVTIFEQNHRIGGLWPISKIDDGLVNPDMCTNQSRHTVSFSDLAWPETAPSFPKAWQVGEYLQKYIEMYPGYDIRLNTKVIRTEFVGEKWKVDVKDDENENVESKEFDHLIVATGFFGKAKIPKIFEGAEVPIWHSSKIREVKDLNTDNGKKTPRGRNIVVVGGQMSGVETAAAIAHQISSLANSPGESSVPDAKDYIVRHVVQKPVWVMPLFFPNNPLLEVEGSSDKKQNRSPNFLPLDLVSYNLGWRPPGPVQNTSGHITPEAARITHGFMKTYIGSDQTDLDSPVLGMSSEETLSEPAILACSDHYTEFVRDGKIEAIEGRVNVEPAGSTVKVESPTGETTEISEIAAIVCATGFDATPSLDFLPSQVLTDLQFDPNDDGFPLALNVHTVVSKLIPSLGFVGFYRSPYWGVMEMQAKFLGALWTGDSKVEKALEEDLTMNEMLKLRNNPRRSQFPMGDYAYLMESFANILDIKRLEPESSAPDSRTGIVLPSRYMFKTADDKQVDEAKKALNILDKIFTESSSNAKFLARAVFRALQGSWKLERTITSRIDTFPSGTLHGTAKMLPRSPTGDADMEYLYFEEGDFRPSWGGVMKAKRSYVYHYVEKSDTMNVWFAKGDYKTSDYFFHQLEFLIPEKPSTGDEPWRAKSSHLCIDDFYEVTYEFFFQGAGLSKWTSRYVVKGPKKDYIIENAYTRPK